MYKTEWLEDGNTLTVIENNMDEETIIPPVEETVEEIPVEETVPEAEEVTN